MLQPKICSLKKLKQDKEVIWEYPLTAHTPYGQKHCLDNSPLDSSHIIVYSKVDALKFFQW